MNKPLKFSYLSFIYIFLYLPVIVLVIYSFNNARFSAVWHGATWKWYIDLFHDAALLTITRNSIVVATFAATVASIIGALGAVALFRYRFLGKKLMNGLIFVLIIVPDLVFGISLLILYAMAKIPLGFLSLLIAHITFCIPFVVVTILSSLYGTNKKIFEAARDLGASDLVIFVRIILPLIFPAVVAGWLLSFTLSLDDVIISFFVTGPSFQILPLYIFSQVHIGLTPEINALCSLIFVFTVFLVLLSQLLLRNHFRKLPIGRLR